ncbi:MAG TPA: molybdate ABC transporter substrate-binding protein [bacterium]|nr:molybdate ABC transporter substrate-binding protein [bacterium]
MAVASDLRFALTEVVGAFELRHSVRVVTTFGSSGQLAAQIEQGAPFDVFFSANEAFVSALAGKGHVDPTSTVVYAIGRIVVWVRRESPVDVRTGLRALVEPRIRFVAIANPQHAPYGVAAVEALRRSGLYERVRGKLVLGENISQTLQFAQTGNADAAIVALSLAVAPPVHPTGRFILIPATLHDPIRQAAGIVARTDHPQLARALLAAMVSNEGQNTLRRYGFAIPRVP